MRRRVLGATLTILGVLSVLFAPEQVDYSVRVGLLSYGSYGFWQLIQWPPGWSWAFLPMLIIGVVLVLTGIVVMGGVRELRRRLIGAAVTTVGVFTVLFAPLRVDAVGCDCPGPFGSYSRWDLIYWPPGWYWVHRPMLIIGVALVVAGMVLMRRARRLN
jgi:hypothetical protein